MDKNVLLRSLVIDDEKSVRFFLKRFLELEKVKVSVAENYDQALEQAKKEKFDLVFIDVRLPGKNGVKTLEALLKIQPQARYVMMTGFSVDKLLQEASFKGAQASIKKPFNTEELLLQIDKCVGK